jgi:hypothetical protein
MKRSVAALVLPLAFGIGACGEQPVAPKAGPTPRDAVASQQNGHVQGTGLVLNSVTGTKVLGLNLGDVVVNQAVVKQFGVVEDIAGNIIGLEVTGALQLTGGILGMDVVTEDFTTGVGVVSSGHGQCELVKLDLAPINLDVLGHAAFVDLPTANVTGRGNGALGSLLCNLGQLASGLVGGVSRGVRGLVNGINNVI